MMTDEYRRSQKQLRDIYKDFETQKRKPAASKEPDNLNILNKVRLDTKSDWIPPWWAKLAKQGGKRDQVIRVFGLDPASASGKRKLSENSPRTPRKRRRRASSEAAERQAKQAGDIVSSF